MSFSFPSSCADDADATVAAAADVASLVVNGRGIKNAHDGFVHINNICNVIRSSRRQLLAEVITDERRVTIII